RSLFPVPARAAGRGPAGLGNPLVGTKLSRFPSAVAVRSDRRGATTGRGRVPASPNILPLQRPRLLTVRSDPMRIIIGAELQTALPYRVLGERLRQAFRAGAEVPMRHHHTLQTDGQNGTLLLMPAWQARQAIGVKIVTVFPDNGASDLPAVQGVYLLLDG